MTVTFIKIKTNGNMDEISCEKLNSSNIQKILQENTDCTMDDVKLQKLYHWTYETYLVECYGMYDGEAGTENKHELIPGGISSFLEEDSSEILLFGNILILLKEKEKYIPMDIAKYGEIYEELFGGFDDCESESEEEEDESQMNTDDEQFINDEECSDQECSDDYTDESIDLDYDKNDYL